MAESDNGVLQNLIAGRVWKTPPTSEQPKINLGRWSVQETETGERFFVGYNIDDREGRVSTPIKSFDPITSDGITRSGRVYHLVGPPGYDEDGAWVWACVCSVRGLTGKDVSDEYLAPIAGCTMEEDKGCGSLHRSPTNDR